MVIVHVAVPVPLRQYFSYSHTDVLAPGTRVLVPFGSRKLVGVVDSCEQKTQSDDSLKTIDTVLDEEPIINDVLIHLAKWLSNYYHHPIGETYATMLPAWLRKEQTREALLSLAASDYLKLTEQGIEALQDEKSVKTPQLEILKWLKKNAQPKITAKQQFSSSTLATLHKKQWITSYTQISEPGIDWLKDIDLAPKPVASQEQGIAIGAMTSSLNAFSISLLEGVTGSGKTEVYLQIIERVLLNGRQVLILIPEIGLTPQTVSRFSHRFNCEVGVLNSQVTDKKRTEIWMKAKLGQLPIVIGTRSAVFTPFFDLGMIVIDEEHDDALKQQDGLRYHARDVAAVRTQYHSIPLLLGSATPSLETLNNAIAGRYRHSKLTQRAANAQRVNQHIIDMKHHTVHAGLTDTVIEQMRGHLQQGNQVLLFLNRRGFAPVLMCHDCGHVEVCHSCDRPMTWHKQKRRLICHHCDIQRPVPQRCEQCGSHNMTPEGLGTEQLEYAVSQLFPDYPVARIDRDNTRKKEAFNALFDGIREGKTKILIGTQMLAKGHHFPNVTLVVIVDVDAGLFSADARAQEKLAQLVTQISGRAGRASKKGEMLLQTHHPEHPVLQELIHNGYAHVARLMLAERKALNSPPFYSQAVVRAESVDASLCQQVLRGVKQCFQQHENLVHIGPMPALIEKRQNRYRFILVLRAAERRTLHRSVNHAVSHLTGDKLAKKLRWSVDVDAIDLT
jgi:primosomal protein N' (replication factor Y)